MVSIFTITTAARESSVLDSIFAIEKVCAPDWFTCPNGRRAFRDNKHNCEFTPCELIEGPATLAPHVDPRTENASKWFQNEEFYVPTLHFRDLQRGKRVVAQIIEQSYYKSQLSLEWERSAAYLRSYDVVLIPSVASSTKNGKTGIAMADKNSDYMKMLEAAVASVAGVNTTSNDSMPSGSPRLVAWTKPWSRYGLYGRLVTVPSEAQIHAMFNAIRDVHNAEMLRTHQRGSVGFGAPVGPSLIVPIPSLVVEEQAERYSGSGGDDWIAHLSPQRQSVFVQFLEANLIRFGKAKKVNKSDSTIAMAGTNGSTTIVEQFIEAISSTKRSVAVFLSRVADDGHVHMSVWNITLVACQSDDVGNELNALGDDSVSSRDSDDRRVDEGDLSDAGSAGDSRSDGESSVTVCSCWTYHQTEDEFRHAIASDALVIHSRMFCHA